MILNKADLEVLRTSLKKMEPHFDTHSVYFYERLFERAPELRAYFGADLSSQGMRFMTAMATILDRLDAPDSAAAELEELGAMHRRMGVRPEQFEPMCEALMDTMRVAMGTRFTFGLEKPWRDAFDMVAAGMITFGKIGEPVANQSSPS